MTQPNSNISDGKQLLEEFSPASYEDWKTAAEALLKGAPFEKKLLTETVEGITLQPIYRQGSVEGLAHIGLRPGSTGSPRGGRASGFLDAPWDSLQEISAGDPGEFNRQLLAGLNAGQTGVLLTTDGATALMLDPDEAEPGEVGACGLSLTSLADWKRCLAGVFPEAVSLHVKPGCALVPLASFLAAWADGCGVEASKLRGGFHADPIGHWLSFGSLPAPYEEMMDHLKAVWDIAGKALPEYGLVACSGMPFHAAGGSAVDELSLMLAEAVEYLRQLGERGLDPTVVAPRLTFHFALGSNFFMELAKIRAARIAWARIQESFGIEEPAPLRAIARTGRFNKTAYDPYVNLLRTTTEAFCGVLGGLEALTVGTFDECVRESDPFSRRIARNTHTILAEECELKRVVDPAGGSWFVENLTDEVLRSAWSRFQEIEAAGGIAKAFRSGVVSELCGKSKAEQKKRLNQRRFSLIGTNVYANPTEERMDPRLPDYKKIRESRVTALGEDASTGEESLDDPAGLIATARRGATVGAFRRGLIYRGGPFETVEPLSRDRLAGNYESLRGAAADFKKRTGSAPKLFLANLGPLRKHKLRADFTSGFFGSGGFEVLYPNGFSDPESAAKAFSESGAIVAVVCGSDDQYAEQFVLFAKALKAAHSSGTVVLAGHPGDSEQKFREAGMDTFLWTKSDNYALNRELLERAGVSLPSES